MSIELVILSNHLILCLPLLLLLSVFTSIRVFSNVQALHIRWPKYWSFSFSISPFNEYSGLICFRIDGFDLLAVQGTLKNLWCWRKLKASILRHSAFFTVQLSHLYVTTEKKIALTIQTFVAYLRLLIFLEACKTIYNVLLGNKTIHLRVIFPWNRNVLHLYRIKSAC